MSEYFSVGVCSGLVCACITVGVIGCLQECHCIHVNNAAVVLCTIVGKVTYPTSHSEKCTTVLQIELKTNMISLY